MKLSGIPAVLLFLAAAAAGAPDLRGIDVLETGVLAFTSMREAKDPTTGQPVYIAIGLRIGEPTRHIRPAEDVVFGFRGRAVGQPSGAPVTFRIVCHFPDRTSESTATRSLGETFLHGCRIRAEDLTHDLGAWVPRIQFFHGETPVLDEKFSVILEP
jgi:hypothetical protein